MIVNLTDNYILIRDKYLKLEKEKLFQVLNFISKSDAEDNCLFCTRTLASVNCKMLNCFQKLIFGSEPGNKINSVEEKLCKSCLLTLHSKNLRIKYINDFPELKSPKQCNRKIYNLKKIKENFEAMKIETFELEQNFSEDETMKPYREYLKKLKITNILKDLIKYKIETIEEQLKIMEENHKNAILDGQLEEAETFKNIFFNLYEKKLKLEEKQCKF